MSDNVHKSAQFKHHFRLLVLVVTIFIGGCASSIVVKPDIPIPLVEKLPINAGLIYTDTFKNYVYLESEKKRNSLKSLDFALAQTTMFDQVFSVLTNLVSLDDSSMHLSIEPEILDFQYSSPSETKLKQYEVWLKYRLKLRDANNASIADWTIKGYGKTPTGALTSASSAFNSATNIALRDVGAQLAIKFPRQRVIKTFLAGGIPEPKVITDSDATLVSTEVTKVDVSNEVTGMPSDEKASSGNADESVDADTKEDVVTESGVEVEVNDE